MPTLDLTDEQAISLVTQLPAARQATLLHYLLTRQWPTWLDLAASSQEAIQALAAQAGHDWTAMSDAEREAFIDDVVHEDRL
jgi:alpha-D-ribose 1-methylphosphonate 5-triphosphate synthase subunit PhnH